MLALHKIVFRNHKDKHSAVKPDSLEKVGQMISEIEEGVADMAARRIIEIIWKKRLLI